MSPLRARTPTTQLEKNMNLDETGDLDKSLQNLQKRIMVVSEGKWSKKPIRTFTAFTPEQIEATI